MKIGLRVLTIGVGIVGCWACLVPLSGAVVVPGTLVVESDLKKIQHPAGGVVANIPVRDGMHVSAGDVLLRLDETQLRANAQVLAQQLDQTRVRTTPQLEGLVSYVSADLNHDRQKNPNAGGLLHGSRDASTERAPAARRPRAGVRHAGR
ncbi:MAG: biotin/lipoyl-binding protein, partial [Pseudolabrys sp.]